jgi:hypothetical protein
MFVTGAPPNRGGPGIPQRAMTSSRSPSIPTRMISASWSGKIAGTTEGCPSDHAALETNRGSLLGLW